MSNCKIVSLLCIAILICAGPLLSLSFPDLRRQAEIQQEWLKIRLHRVLPDLMRRHKISMWLVICREYNEDPVFQSLVSPTVFAARRRTILVFFDRGSEKGLERLALGGGSNGGLYDVYRDPDSKNRELWGKGQWITLRKVIEERDPANIAINVSETHAFSDGLTAAEKQSLESVLGPKWTSRLTPANTLPIEYLGTRIPEMKPVYTDLMQLAHKLISRAFSNEVIKPGVTTNMDVVWWLREQVRANGMDVWFQPSVHVQRKGAAGVQILQEQEETVIQRGDVLHTDFGIHFMGLATDTQHMGYVLKEGESDVPPGVQKALQSTNQLQDLLIERMQAGKTGNEVLMDTLDAMRKSGINGSVYTHPIGDHGHGAGPLIGLWDRQEPVPDRGELKLFNDTWFSIELAAETEVPEWSNEKLWVGQEEDAMLMNDKVEWVLPRQTKYHLVK